jgi:protease-4
MHIPPLSPRIEALLVLFALLLVLYLFRVFRRMRAVRRGTWVKLEVKGTVLDVPMAVPPLRRLLARRTAPTTVLALRRFAREVNRDARVAGVLLRLGEVRCGWATAASVRDVIQSMRAAGKRVIVYLPHGAGTRETFIAMAGEKVFASPQSTMAPLGVAANATFYKPLLAKAGVEAESIARREFKSAADSFTRDSMSDANRLQLNALVETLHGALVEAIATGRGRSKQEANEIVDEAMLRAPLAVEKRLIDGVAYDDEMPSKLGEKARTMKAGQYLATANAWKLLPWWPKRGRRVGIVEVRGAIVDDAGAALGRIADATHVGAALRVARAHPGIGAVVLYVDSPGGSALASDLIAREVERLKEKKPVVAYFANTAASGGYYVSALASEIVAQPVTITGSIGVIAMRFVLERTLEKLGLRHEVIRRGAHADLMSPYRHWNDEERALFDREIDGAYKDFVSIVARGRKRSFDEIEPLARGRVYSGKDALAVGLVDRLGGLETAIARAAELGDVKGDRDPVMIHPPRHLPEPPEPPPAVEPIAQRLGVSLDLVNLALASSPRETIFAIDERIAEMNG